MKIYFLFVSLLLFFPFFLASSQTKDLVMIYSGVSEGFFSGASLEIQGEDSLSKFSSFVRRYGLSSPNRSAQLAPKLYQREVNDFGFRPVQEMRKNAITCSFLSEKFILCSFVYGILVDPKKVYVYDKNCAGNYSTYIQSRMTLFAYLKELKRNHDKQVPSYLGTPVFDKDGKITSVNSTMFRMLEDDEETVLPVRYNPEILLEQDRIRYDQLFVIKEPVCNQRC